MQLVSSDNVSKGFIDYLVHVGTVTQHVELVLCKHTRARAHREYIVIN